MHTRKTRMTYVNIFSVNDNRARETRFAAVVWCFRVFAYNKALFIFSTVFMEFFLNNHVGGGQVTVSYFLDERKKLQMERARVPWFLRHFHFQVGYLKE